MAEESSGAPSVRGCVGDERVRSSRSTCPVTPPPLSVATLRFLTGLIGVPVALVLYDRLVGRGWDGSSAALLLGFVGAALNLADADVSPVANLGSRAATSL